MRRAALPLTILVAVSFGPMASAGRYVDAAVDALRSDRVYVHPDADPTLTPDEATHLRGTIAAASVPVYVAVLPDEAGAEAGGYDGLPRAIGQGRGGTGAFAVIAGRHFRAGSRAGMGLEEGDAGRLATAAFNAHPPQSKGIAPMLEDFVARVQSAGAPPPPPAKAPAQDAPVRAPDEPLGEPGIPFEPVDREPSRFPGGGLFVLVALAAIAIALVRRFASSGSGTRSLELGRRRIRSDISVLDAEIAGYTEGGSAEADADYHKALGYRDQAYAELGSAERADELFTARRAARKARWAMDCARARLDGRPLPPEPPDPEPEPEPEEYASVGGKRRYWHGGGMHEEQYYRAGWYSTPNFWQGMFFGSLLSDILDDDEPAHEHSSGGWFGGTSSQGGGSGSGDWGGSSGGGDWGGSGGGGDWGGSSGGDSGGGSSGGGGGDW